MTILQRTVRILPALMLATLVPMPALAATTGDTSDAAVACDGAGEHAKGGPHGPGSLVFSALSESIGLTAGQRRTINDLVPALPQGPHPFDKTRATALAAAIRAGKVDATIDASKTAEMASQRAADANAIDLLHAVLTQTQRKALVAAIEQKEAAHESAEASDGRTTRHARFNDAGATVGPLARMLEGLDLTTTQQEQILAKLEAIRPAHSAESRDAMRAEMKAKLETFVNDSFDATAFVTPPAGEAKSGDHGDRFLTEMSVVTSVLNATQREKLAERIEEGPPPRAQTRC